MKTPIKKAWFKLFPDGTIGLQTTPKGNKPKTECYIIPVDQMTDDMKSKNSDMSLDWYEISVIFKLIDHRLESGVTLPIAAEIVRLYAKLNEIKSHTPKPDDWDC